MRIMVFVCAAWIASAGFAPAIAQDALVIDDVPLPANTRITSSSGISENFKRFSGAWIGAWGGLLHHILIVENIRPDGNANIIYAVGDNAAANVHRQWRRDIAVISGNMLRVGTFATYEFTADGRLKATYSGGNSRASATMLKVELAELTRPGAEISWIGIITEFLDTTLNEDGRPVRLEVVLAKPAGSGPFPLAVLNHGSTGRGTNPALFKQTQWSPELADFLVDRGWMVAFPQRRGRGKSDGIYDEGFAADRTQGYSCDPNRSLLGADRALTDIGAAIEALRRRTDVAMTPILIGGVSRGGILSIAYAGQHP
jgi:hypothetical protein